MDQVKYYEIPKFPKKAMDALSAVAFDSKIFDQETAMAIAATSGKQIEGCDIFKANGSRKGYLVVTFLGSNRMTGIILDSADGAIELHFSSLDPSIFDLD